MRTPFVVGAILLALSPLGCATSAPAHHPDCACDHKGEHHMGSHAMGHGSGAWSMGSSSVRPVDLAAPALSGKTKEVAVLVDEAPLKLVTMVLKKGTTLAEHHSPHFVTIQALSGTGVVKVAGVAHKIDTTHAIALAPKVMHSVEADAGADLVLLVHHFGRGGDHEGSHAGHGGHRAHPEASASAPK